jgi:hypothetical protein
MTDSIKITYGQKFLEAVKSGEYENMHTKLPDVMNLLERGDAGNTVLHYCAEKNYIVTFLKILHSGHPAVGLLVSYKNHLNETVLDLLLKKTNLSQKTVETLFNKIKAECPSNTFSEILESCSDVMQNPKVECNKYLKTLIETASPKPQRQSYTPTYSQQTTVHGLVVVEPVLINNSKALSSSCFLK